MHFFDFCRFIPHTRQRVNFLRFRGWYFYFARSIPKQPCAICLSCLLYSEVGLYHKDFSALLRGDRKADRNRCPLPQRPLSWKWYFRSSWRSARGAISNRSVPLLYKKASEKTADFWGRGRPLWRKRKRLFTKTHFFTKKWPAHCITLDTMWSCYKEHRADALALRADERRDKLR